MPRAQRVSRSASVTRQDGALIQDQHSRDRSTAQRAQDAGDERTDSESRDIASPARRNLRKHADLGAQRADVAKAAQTVSGNQLRAVAHGHVDGLCDELPESGEFVL
jgi:hypothetical protein